MHRAIRCWKGWRRTPERPGKACGLIRSRCRRGSGGRGAVRTSGKSLYDTTRFTTEASSGSSPARVTTPYEDRPFKTAFSLFPHSSSFGTQCSKISLMVEREKSIVLALQRIPRLAQNPNVFEPSRCRRDTLGPAYPSLIASPFRPCVGPRRTLIPCRPPL